MVCYGIFWSGQHVCLVKSLFFSNSWMIGPQNSLFHQSPRCFEMFLSEMIPFGLLDHVKVKLTLWRTTLLQQLVF